MKKGLLLWAVVCGLSVSAHAQTYFSKTANVYFNATSQSSPEDIEASQQSGTLVINMASGNLESVVLLKTFHFERALMEEHFNENYVESDKYPKANFKGKISNMGSVNLKQDGTYNVNLDGSMTLHGVTKPIQATGKLTVKNGQLVQGKANFNLLLADFGIKIPGAVKDKIAEKAAISVEANLQSLK